MANKSFEQFTPVTDKTAIDTANDFLAGNDVSAPNATKDTKYTFDLLQSLINVGVIQDDSGAPIGGSTSLTINSNTKFIKLALNANWTPLAITGFEEGKEVILQISSSTLPLYPFQITFPSTIKPDDGVTPVLKVNTSGVFDYIYLLGTSPTTAQITKVVYGSNS